MNAPILRVYGVIVILFALLIVFTSRWTVWQADALRENTLNRRVLLEELEVKRGNITADDGTTLARSVPGQGKTFKRFYPTAGLFAQPIGYANVARGQLVGFEKARNNQLSGQDGSLNSLVDQFSGKRKEGDAIRTTLDPKAQKVAFDQLAGRKGSVVALDPRTGAVKVMAASPTYDPNDLTKPGTSLFNRATQAAYAPGSTFKVVTAVAGIDSGKYTPNSVLDGSSPKRISGVQLSNDGGESFGSIDLTNALTHSVNTVFAQVGVGVGKSTMAKYMERFGFYSAPPLDYPSDQRRASGEFKGQHLLDPTSDQIDVGRMAIGQDKLAVTPLQMAMVASAVANNGKLMRPHMADRVVDPDGRTVETVKPRVQSTVMKPQTAQKVNEMMQQVVREGTGTAAALTGIDVAGKTGTAEVPCGPGNLGVQTWFIAFAPARNPKSAVAATVECSGGQGGTVAAPIAKAVMESLLNGHA
jgi:peptidoglycan glycosyltransferase